MEKHCVDDIVFQILTWLPTKSLMRFKCVSKTWNIQHDPDFVKLHNARPSTTRLLLFEVEVCPRREDDLSIKKKRPELERFSVQLLAPRHYFNYYQMSVCSNYCNGLVCLYSFKDTQTYLYSVTTGEIKALPFSMNQEIQAQYPLDPQLFLGFDSITEKYKLLHIFVGKNNGNRVIKTRIRTLGIDSSWRKFHMPSNCFLKPKICIFLNGVIYSTDYSLNCICIYYFNFRTEKFGRLSPKYCSYIRLNKMQTALRGKLVIHCCFNHNGRRENRNLLYDDINNVFMKLKNSNYPNSQEKVALIEAERIDKMTLSDVLLAESIT
uniref:F-box protein At1g32420 n=2 Tax=Nicotiana TaxID=4085 RepID=A0A1S4DI61_TOBAC|nr:PREDICTED: putative F-box protein At1g32420 [Nicotiana sylvestris]XP_016513090.1 PREDICTED: putative F-box protein At1g32420 [Nicotiana tabacum]